MFFGFKANDAYRPTSSSGNARKTRRVEVDRINTRWVCRDRIAHTMAAGLSASYRPARRVPVAQEQGIAGTQAPDSMRHGKRKTH
ncbi:MAG: hypothetical protein IPH54_14210 [Rhodoferax sp.]|nr:hypothetical protein [Rhodoferax sp.]